MEIRQGLLYCSGVQPAPFQIKEDMDKDYKYFILEDEPYAYEEIRRMMGILRPGYVLHGWAASVEEALVKLKTVAPDLMIVDIRLSDGSCFDVLEHINLQTPIIFTTAYDEYALQAFRVNSIDYLLKPVEEEELERALQKLETCYLTGDSPEAEGQQANLPTEYCHQLAASYLKHVKKNRFLVSVGDSFSTIESSDIAFFYSEDKYVFLHLFTGKRYIINYSLDQLEPMLDERDFHRVSRSCIAHIKAVKKASRYFGSRLLMRFTVDCPQEVIVSRSRVAEVLKWMDGQGL